MSATYSSLPRQEFKLCPVKVDAVLIAQSIFLHQVQVLYYTINCCTTICSNCVTTTSILGRQYRVADCQPNSTCPKVANSGTVETTRLMSGALFRAAIDWAMYCTTIGGQIVRYCTLRSQCHMKQDLGPNSQETRAACRTYLPSLNNRILLQKRINCTWRTTSTRRTSLRVQGTTL